MSADAEPPAAADPRAAPRRRTWALAITLLAVALPFAAARFPPITDLPQHVAQVRLLGEALSHPNGPYAVQWLTPYGLSYGVVGLAWLLAGPVLAGRLAAFAIAALWVASLHWLAWRRGRAAEQAVLASLLVFHHGLYWGLLNFLFGWVAFVAWFLARPGDDGAPGTGRWRHVACTAAVYFSHALWFAFAGVWQCVESVLHRRPPRAAIRALLPLLPFALLGLWWFHGLQSTRYGSITVWPPSLGYKLAPQALAGFTLGGLRGRAEPLALLAVLGWVALSLWQHRRALRTVCDRDLLALAGTALVLYVLLPLKFQNTIRFAERWLPIAAVAALLALPPPRLRPRLRFLAAGAVLVVFCAFTAAVWLAFDEVEMSGMEEALAALPPAPRVLGLDFAPDSRLVRDRPFLQAFAYAQVRRGGTLNFSFADFAPSLVVYRPERAVPWTPGLEWTPGEVRAADFGYFDFVLVHGAPDALAAKVALDAVTHDGQWRLYRVPHPSDAPQAAPEAPAPRPRVP